ncbi:MAG: hypothetical protein DIZ80_10980 [endosymbiont of Galathealinum brachiosum]|uniref:Porin n=1 Tax=endosymbiont of Galathealinum brachiosum TaxID=2200906 RepID=A0A370DD33_9GAMM|nr:MAG: hypothetical protein DIZ80_10980 [endosymbiont of Galathealinum brachiosum]
MKKLNLLALSAAVAGALVSGTAAADLTGNIGLSNNYLWRGVTQTGDSAAISGGIDYSNESGVYAGVWVANIDDFDSDPVTGSAYEMDLYAGYAGEAGSIGYDVGFITYQYPLSTDVNFTEVYVGVDVVGLELDVAFTVDTDAGGDDADIYASVGYSFDLGNDLSLGLLYGNYAFDAAGSEDYSHYSASLGKGDFSFALEANDTDADDDMRVVVAWGQEFEL